MWSNKIYAGKRFANLSFLVMENPVEIYTVHKNEDGIEKLISNSIDSNKSILKLDENKKLKLLLIKYKNIISFDSNDFGRCSALKHQIDTRDIAPIRMSHRRIPYHQQEEVQNDIAENNSRR